MGSPDRLLKSAVLSKRSGDPKVMALIAQGRSYRLIGREVGLSKNTVVGIVKRHRANNMRTIMTETGTSG